MNKFVRSGIASVMASVGLAGAPTHAFSAYIGGGYLRKRFNTQSVEVGHVAQIESQFVGELRSRNLAMKQTINSKLHIHQEPELLEKVQATPKNDTGLVIKSLNPVVELVILDVDVENKHVFYNRSRPGVEIVELSFGENGLDQIEAILSRYSKLHAVHIVSHSVDGQVQLGGKWFDSSAVSTHVDFIASLNASVVVGGDLLFYGCNLASGEKGNDFLDILYRSTHLDIASSDDLTGNSSSGGDWDLEIRRGDVNSELPFSQIALQDFSSVLAPVQYVPDDFCTADCGLSSSSYTSTDTQFVFTGFETEGAAEQVNVYAYDTFRPNDGFYLTFQTNTDNEYSGYLRFSADGSNLSTFELTGLVTSTYGGGSCSSGSVIGYVSGGGTVSNSLTMSGTGNSATLTNFSGVQITHFHVVGSGCSPSVYEGIGVASFTVDNKNAGNAAPDISIDNANLAYTENASATQIDSAGTVSDTDGDADWNGGSLSIQITANNEAGDQISISDEDGDGTAITVSGTNIFANGTDIGNLSTSGGVVTNGTALTITFDSDATNSNVQEVLQSIRYSSTIEDPGTSNRTVTFTATDVNLDSNNDTRTIAVTAVNDEPTLTATGSNPSFTEGGAAASLFSSTSVSTIESGQTLSGFTLTVTNLADGSSEILNADGTAIALTNGNSGTTATNGLSYNVSVSGGTATVTFSGGTLSTAATQTLVDALSYQNNSDDADTTNRVVTLTSITDSGSNVGSNDNVAALAVASTVTLTEINDEPTLTATGSDPTFTEGGSAASLFSGSSVSAIESGQVLTSMTLTVTNLADGSSEILNADGSAIALTNANSGTTATNSLSYNVAVSGSTATVSLSGGTLSSAAVQTLIDAMSYQNNANDPNTTNRVVTITSLSDSGSNAGANDNVASLAVASTVTVTAVNDEPTLTATGSDPSFSEDGSAASLYSGSSVNTIESGQTVAGFTLTVTNLADGSDEILNADGTAITLTNGANGTTATNSLSYSVAVAGSTATVTFTGGTLSTAAMQTLVDALSYQNNSDDPNTSNRVVTLTSITDSGSNAGANDNVAALAVASTVAVTSVNDEPTLTATGSNPSFTEGGSAASLFSGSSVSTVESGQTLAAFTLTVTNVADGSDEILNLDGSAIALTDANSGTTATNSLSYSVSVSGSTATVSISGATLSSAAMQTLVDALSYQNDSDAPDTTARVVTLTSLQDSGGTANSGDDTTSLSVASTITVIAVNTAPTDIALDSASISQSAGVNGVVGALSSTDVDDSSFTYSLVAGTGDTHNASFNISGSQLRANDASALSAGNYSVRIESDDGEDAYEESFTITVVDDVAALVTSVSVPANATYTLAENLDFTVNFDENITVSGTPRLSLTVGGSTRYASYQSGSGSSSLSFRYTVQSGDNDSDGIALGSTIDLNSGTLQDAATNAANLTLNSVGSLASVLVDTGAPTLSEVTAVSALGNDSTPSVTFSTSEAGTLAVGGSCGSASEGAVSSGNNSIDLTQTDNSTALADGAYNNCTVTVTDAAGNASTALTLTAFTVDTTAPSIDTNLGLSLDEAEQGVQISNSELSASDVNSAAADVVYTVSSVPANGALAYNGSDIIVSSTFTQADIDAGLLSYSHDGSETTSDSFNFSIADELGNSAGSTSFSFTIAAVNDAPDTSADAETTNEDTAVMVDVLANDSDADDALNAASVTVSAAPTNGSTSVNTGTGVITYTPAANFNGVDSFSYTVEDASGDASDPALVTITVISVNDIPVAQNDVVAVDINSSISIDVAANDSDVDTGDTPDTATISIVAAPSDGSAVINAGQVDYTPDTDFTGTDSFTYTIDDGNGATSNVATVTITVTDPNSVPVATNDSATVDEDGEVDIDVLANDSDADGSLQPNTVTVATAPSNGSTFVDVLTGEITYTPAANFNGSDSFSYTVEDDLGATSMPATVSVTVNSINDAPVASDDTVTLLEDASLSINALGNDSDVDGTLVSSSISVVTQPVSGVVTVQAGGALLYTPVDDFAGNDSFQYRVSDNDGLASNLATVTLTVEAVNDAPLANDDEAHVVPGVNTVISVLSNDQDIDGTLDAASLTITSAATIGTVTVNGDGSVSYLNDSGVSLSGGDSFSYTIDDNSGASSNEATVTIDFNAPTAPTISGSPTTDLEDGESYEFTPTASTSEGYTAEFSVENLPSWASFDDSTGAITGTVAEEDIGVYSNIVLSLSDGVSTVSLPAFAIEVFAATDTDGDTISDRREEIDGTDPNDPTDYLDLMPPVFAAPEAIIVDATALFTPLSIRTLLGLASDADQSEIDGVFELLVSDNVDGAGCCAPTLPNANANGNLVLAPGHHRITWRATDNMANSADVQQDVYVRPLVSLSKDSVTVEGQQKSFKVLLNGRAPFYPFEVPFVIDSASSASSADHNLQAGSVIFLDGETERVVTVQTLADDIVEADEELRVLLDDRTTASEDLADGFQAGIFDINAGAKTDYRLTITESNLAPTVELSLQQNGSATAIVDPASGLVTVTATASDPNGDSVALSWSASSAAIADIDGDSNDASFVFDPSELAAGAHRVNILAEDSEGASDSSFVKFRVLAQPIVLSNEEDSDGDGVDDASEGTADSDTDGIPDYLDNIDLPNVIPEVARETDSFLVECDPGVRCRLGEFAFIGDSGGARLNDEDFDSLEDLVVDEDFEPVGGVFDFELHELPTAGQTVRVVLPQIAAIPSDAVYRKFADGQWRDFVEDADNLLHSAPGSLGFCPPPGDEAWSEGLTEGHFCVQLSIEDGGPNDTDGEVNASVSDPGAVSQARPVDPPPPASTTLRSSAKGGGSSTPVLLMLLAFAAILGARKKARVLPAVLVAGLAFTSLSPERAVARDWLQNSFVELSISSYKGDQSGGEFTRAMASEGVSVDVQNFDVQRSGFYLGVGYRFTEHHGLMLGYADLGKVEVNFTATPADDGLIEGALEQHYPLSGSGVLANYRYQRAFADSWQFNVDAGLFIWSADSSVNDSDINPNLEDGSDFYYGAGLSYSVTEQILLGLRYQNFALGGQNVTGLGLGFSHQF